MLSLKPRKQPDSINQGNHQPALVAVSMTSYLRHQLHDRVDLELGMPKIGTETVTDATCPRAARSMGLSAKSRSGERHAVAETEVTGETERDELRGSGKASV